MKNKNEDVHSRSARYDFIGFIVILIMMVTYYLFK